MDLKGVVAIKTIASPSVFWQEDERDTALPACAHSLFIILKLSKVRPKSEGYVPNPPRTKLPDDGTVGFYKKLLRIDAAALSCRSV